MCALLGTATLVAGLVGGSGAAEAADASTAPEADWDVNDGHFYSQAAGLAPGQVIAGFVISNEGGIPFWTEYRRLGGPSVLGYPASHRFIFDGRMAQLTQRSLLVWVPEEGRVRPVNLFQRFPALLQTPVVATGQRLPAPMDPPGEPGPTTEAAARLRLKLLDTNPAIKAHYFSAPDPAVTYGLPQSSVRDYGDSYLVLFQRAIIQQWKKDMPWAAAGDVRVLNVGDVVKGMGAIPGAAVAPGPGPAPVRLPPGPTVELGIPAALKPAANVLSPVVPSSVGSDWLNVWVTGYVITGTMANGNWTHSGAAAADWHQFPPGTRIEVGGLGTVTVEDTGSAVGPNHLDIWVSSLDEAYSLTGWYRARRLG